MSNAGRKSSYKAEFGAMIASLAQNPESILVRGQVSDTKIARMIAVSPETVRKWKKIVPGRENEYQPDFAAAIKQCQDAVDTDSVKRSMIAKAKGFTSRKVIREVNQDGKLKVVKEIKETVSGDVAAARLVLNNIDHAATPWNTADKQQMDGSLKIDGLTQILGEIDGSGKRLPKN